MTSGSNHKISNVVRWKIASAQRVKSEKALYCVTQCTFSGPFLSFRTSYSTGKRIRKTFSTKGEALAFELHIMKEVDDKPCAA
ncbi:hypothetical protein PBPRA1383 [Photobacterium profundum SS9]|uniref:Uncharacterized protein n=1 Tax=Photobacterium profundum (strain SS9) TaxID=298386 RepID=Q6LSD2_PHOPR|nr:hypothetical protein PBPRA1383 [Photobacterium profundum SS9]